MHGSSPLPAGPWNAPFAGIPSFLRTRIAGDLGRLDADIAVMGVPSDELLGWLCAQPWRAAGRDRRRARRAAAAS